LSLNFTTRASCNVIKINDYIYEIENICNFEIEVSFNVQYIKIPVKNFRIQKLESHILTSDNLPSEFENDSINKCVQDKCFKISRIDNFAFSTTTFNDHSFVLQSNKIDNFTLSSKLDFNFKFNDLVVKPINHFEIKNNIFQSIKTECIPIKKFNNLKICTNRKPKVSYNYKFDESQFGVLTFEKYQNGPVQLVPLNTYIERSKKLYLLHYYIITVIATYFSTEADFRLSLFIDYKDPIKKNENINKIYKYLGVKYASNYYRMLDGKVSLNEIIQILMSFKYFDRNMIYDTVLTIYKFLRNKNTQEF
jgi:hypothetical protein